VRTDFQEDEMTQQRSGLVLGVGAVASFMVALDALVVSTALSTIRTDLHASLGQLEWTVNAYALSFAVLMMTAAAVGDRLGRRRLFVAGLALFAAASAACALSTNVTWLVTARAVQGVGAALVMPLALALVGAAFPPERRGWAMGVFSSVTGVAVLCGPLVGGAVVEGISWAWIFWLNVPIAATLIVLTRTGIAESFGPRTRIDVGGVALVTATCCGLAWGLMRSTTLGWSSSEVVLSLLAGVAFGAGFVWYERRIVQPMLPLRLFASRGFSAGNTAIFFWSASVAGTVFFMAQYLQTVLGNGPLGTGVRLVPWGAVTFLVPQLAGRMLPRTGPRPLIGGGMLLQAVSMAWVAVIAGTSLGYSELVAPLVLSGTGLALSVPAIQATVMGAVAPPELGKASGTLSTVRQLGAVFGVGILAAAFTGFGGYGSAARFGDGFVAAMVASALLSLAGALTAVVLPGRTRVSRRARELATAAS
jgi:EmrB/QacA subfamily drug resistance transporter